MKSGYLSGPATDGGGTVLAPQAIAIRASPTASALIRINLILLRRGRRQPLDEPPGDVCFDDDFTVCGDVAHDAGHAVQARNLLAIELRATIEGDRCVTRVERMRRRHLF